MNGWQTAIAGENVKVADLRVVYSQNRSRPAFPAEATSLLEQLDEDVAWRAVWLLCRSAEEGLLTEHEQRRVAESIDASRHWAWRLLVCQLFGRVECVEDRRDEVFPFLQSCFRDRRPIVRAWALTAMWLFRTDRRYRREILRTMREARKDRAASMIARVRLLTAKRPRRRNASGRGAKATRHAAANLPGG